MKNPVQITLRGIPRSDALERCIDEEAHKLDRICDRIVSCHMIAEKLQSSEGKQFVVRLNFTLPGSEVAVNRDDEQDIYTAVRSAFEAAGRRLQDYVSRVGQVEHHPKNRKIHP